MNERIKQLVDQCWEEDGIGPADFNPEKFAELIIRECIEQGKHVQSQTVSNGSEEYNEGRKMGIEVFINQIKKHFGVEE